MKLRSYIVGIGLLLSACMPRILAQDYLEVVCAGDTGMSYFVNGLEGSSFNWTVEGGSIARNYGDSIIVNWGTVPGEYSMTVQEVSENGCSGGIKTAYVYVSAPPVLDLGGDTYICEGDVFTLSLQGMYSSILWSDGSTLPEFSTSGEGWITCRVTDQYGCSLEEQLYLDVMPGPSVYLGDDISLCGEESFILDAGTDGSEYLWSTGEIGQRITVYQGAEEFWVRVSDEYGCVDSDSIRVELCDLEEYFSDIPTAITPTNQDGVNDYWEIVKLQSFPDAVVDIFDRWGRLIWRSEPGYPAPWEGRNMNGKEMPMDSYHFVIRLNNEQKDKFSGSVTIIK